MDLIPAVIGTLLPGSGAIYLRQQVNFLAPIYPRDTIIAVVGEVALRPDKNIDSLQTNCYNQDNQTVITREAMFKVDRIFI
jgi:acyl dehydratase